jgi:ABC-type sugar transport systems, permease components
MKRIKSNGLPSDVLPNKSRLKFREGVWAWGFLSPTLVLFVVFTLIPLILAVVLSFTNYDLYSDVTSAGWANYQKIFTGVIGKDFWRTIKNVLYFAAMSVPMTVAGSLLAANLVNAKLRGMKVYRFIYYLPAVTSGVATAFCWKMLLNYNNGFINSIITMLGGERIDWLGSYSYLPLFSIAIIATWGALGGNMLIYLAALKGINPDLYEAADLDGANGVKKFLHITLPSVRPTTFFIVTMSIIGAFQLFDTVYFVSSGSIFTNTPVLLIYTVAFKDGYAGLGSAMSVVLFLIIMAVTFVVQKLLKERS